MSGISKNSQVMKCQYCEKSVSVPRNRWESFKYCSRKCLWASHNKNNRITKKCNICGDEFSVIHFREKTAKYCSKKCYYKSMSKAGSVELECDACGKLFNRPPSRSKYPQKACSIKCRGLLVRKTKPSTAAYARKWMLARGFILQCEVCGYNAHPEILVIHHKNRDRKNNSKENLQVLCPNCHAIEHYGQ